LVTEGFGGLEEDAVSSHRELRVWQRAIAMVPRLYAIAARFPDSERFGLADQIRRAAVSVPANIAEGQARQHRKEFIQSLCVARGSLAELDTLLVVARELGFVSGPDVVALEAEFGEIIRLLQALINSLRTHRSSPRKPTVAT
jgi:four helix bundle protein